MQQTTKTTTTTAAFSPPQFFLVFLQDDEKKRGKSLCMFQPPSNELKIYLKIAEKFNQRQGTITKFFPSSR